MLLLHVFQIFKPFSDSTESQTALGLWLSGKCHSY